MNLPENLKKVIKNIETTVKNIKYEEILKFVKENLRYFAAGAVFILLMVVLVNFTGSTEKEDGDVTVAETEEAVTEEAFLENAIPAVNGLVTNYFNAYALGDVTALSAYATPIGENEQSYIGVISQYVEAYQNIDCYTKSGLADGEYLVNVSLEVKFTDIETAAPGLYFFYVRTNEDGSLYIDNLYSEYNFSRQENALDSDVYNLITEFYNSTDVILLQADVEEKYDAALQADENLLNLCATTIPNAVAEWRNTIIAGNAAESTETAEPTEAAETETPAGETSDETTQPAVETQTQSETVYVTTKVNVRASADANAQKLGSVEKGASLTRTGTEGDWSIVEYNGATGYVKSEYLSAEAPAEEETVTVTGLSEGTVVTLDATTNIRSAMSETSEKVGVAYIGEKVTVVMSYAEGWTKVKWNGETGYVKTELLQ